MPPDLMRRLARARIRPRFVAASNGIGERRSRHMGQGMEFEEYRPYEAGDDLRYVDTNAYRRTGRPYVKRFAAYRQLRITLIVDGSRSMAHGSPPKDAIARGVADGLAYVSLSGGDRLRLATFGSRVRWYPWSEGERRFALARSRIQEAGSMGTVDVADAVRDVVRRGASGDLVVIVSDFFAPDAPGALAELAATGAEIVAVQVLSPDEIEPPEFGGGGMRFVDAESGDAVDVALSEHVRDAYRRELAAWTDAIRDAVVAGRGRLLQVRSDASLRELFELRWLQEELIG